jgi:UDP-N-acetylglucosamine 2-epimerase
MIKVLTVVGARPQFIKAAVVSQAMAECGQVKEILLHTGQHYDLQLSGALLKELRLPEPKYNLHVGSRSHGAQTARMLEGIEQVLLTECPHGVLVFGDANSALAGALAAAKLHLPVAHIEAGVRSRNRLMPEEINRIITDHISDWLFCPTEQARRNLAQEGITSNVHWVGDVMYDAFLAARTPALSRSEVLCRLHLSPHAYALATVHRAENTDVDSRLGGIVEALEIINRTLPVVFPVHPRTRKMLGEALCNDSSLKLSLIDPLGYIEMVALESQAAVIITDSGGVQKEAFWNGVPCVTLRCETEWPETVSAGANILAGTQTEKIVESVLRAIGSPRRAPMDVFGNGRAAYQIAEHLVNAWKERAPASSGSILSSRVRNEVATVH